MTHDRQERIMQLLEMKGEVQLQELKAYFPDVSLMTLRRDLTSLENEGCLIRTHGGAVNAKRPGGNGEEDPYSSRAMENMTAKMKIAETAAELVEPGRAIFLDAGSTVMCLAKYLPDAHYTIITSGANIAMELLKKPQISVITVGGQLNRNTLSMSGPHAQTMLTAMNIDLAFMAASGFSLRSGFTVSNVYECELKRKVVERAKKTVMLLDTSKINKELPFTYATLPEINLWITETAPTADVEAEARKHGVEILM